jgi:hypothetical protein
VCLVYGDIGNGRVGCNEIERGVVGVLCTGGYYCGDYLWYFLYWSYYYGEYLRYCVYLGVLLWGAVEVLCVRVGINVGIFGLLCLLEGIILGSSLGTGEYY